MHIHRESNAFYIVYKSKYVHTLFRRNGFVYQYIPPTLYKQDLEGYLDINISDSVSVVGGLCQDFFEFREVHFVIAT